VTNPDNLADTSGAFAYARDRRIVKTDEFSSVFRLRPIQRTAHFVLYARANQLAQARLGVVVAKRYAPRAVTRNAIKRASRELFRLSVLPAVDCIIRLSKPVNAKSGPAITANLKAVLRAELKQLLGNAAPAMTAAATSMVTPAVKPMTTPTAAI
jgi:ribonuclease P protein component